MIDEELGMTQSAATDRQALVVVAGLPGAGKGTQCAQIAADLRVAHFSLGDALRDDVARRTPLGLQVRAFLETGRLVPDRLVLEAIHARLARERAPLVLLDGFPRTVLQAEALERALPGAVSLAVLLAVPLATVRKRLLSRGRADDAEVALRERLASFERDTKPMLDWYERHGSLVVVDADRPRRDVTVAVEALLARSLMTLPYPTKDAHDQRPGSRSYGKPRRLGIATP